MKKNDLSVLKTELSSLRRKLRDHLGGVKFVPLSGEFGIYKCNIESNEAYISHIEHHLVEVEKLLSLIKE